MNVLKRFWKLTRQDKRSASRLVIRLKVTLLVDLLEHGPFTPQLDK